MDKLYVKQQGRTTGKIVKSGEAVRVFHARRRLRPEVVFLLGAASALLMAWLLLTGINRYEKIAHACDEARGYTCSYYEVQLFSLGH